MNHLFFLIVQHSCWGKKTLKKQQLELKSVRAPMTRMIRRICGGGLCLLPRSCQDPRSLRHLRLLALRCLCPATASSPLSAPLGGWCLFPVPVLVSYSVFLMMIFASSRVTAGRGWIGSASSQQSLLERPSNRGAGFTTLTLRRLSMKTKLLSPFPSMSNSCSLYTLFYSVIYNSVLPYNIFPQWQYYLIDCEPVAGLIGLWIKLTITIYFLYCSLDFHSSI